MAEAGQPKQIVGMASHIDPDVEAAEYPLIFGVHHNDTKGPTLDFVSTTQSVWGLSNLAVIWNAKSAKATALCTEILEALREDATGVKVVFSAGTFAGAHEETLTRAAQTSAEVLVSCVDNAAQAQELLVAAQGARILTGWNPDSASAFSWCGPSGCVNPAYVETDSLKFFYFTAGAGELHFAAAAGGWAQKTLGPAQWHHELQYQDPFLGSASAVDALWRSRADFGNGQAMSEEAAAAVAAGVTLRLALERAGGTDTPSVLQALAGLDAQTFWGRVRFGSGRRNAGLQRPVVQWDCALGVACHRQPRLPRASLRPAAANTAMQPLHPACPPDQLRSDFGHLFRVSYAPVISDTDQQPAFPDTWLKPPCNPCMRANMSWLSDVIVTDPLSRQSIVHSCSESFSRPSRYGVALQAGPGDTEAVRGVQRSVDFQKMRMSEIYQMKVYPVVVPRVEAADGASAAGAAMAEGMAALNSTLRALADNAPFGWLIWNDGLRRQLHAPELGPACDGGGPQLLWGQLGLCMAPALRLQGRALVQVVDFFGWQRLHVLVSEGPEHAAMLQELERTADERSLSIASRQLLPAAEGALRAEALRAAAALDDCASSIVVLLLSRLDAQAVFARLELGRRAGLVLVGSEAASRAPNAPVGMLAIRTVAIAESPTAANIMAGEGQTWGTGVADPPVALTPAPSPSTVAYGGYGRREG